MVTVETKVLDMRILHEKNNQKLTFKVKIKGHVIHEFEYYITLQHLSPNVRQNLTSDY